MEILQYLIIIFVLFASSRVMLQFRKKTISFGQYMFWQVLWVFLLIFGLFSSYFNFLTTLLGIQRLVDVIIYASIGILFYLIYRLYIRIEDIHKDISILVRNDSIKNAKRKKN